MMTARQIMTGNAQCIGENDTLEEAARTMRDLDVGSLPICCDDNRLKGRGEGRPSWAEGSPARDAAGDHRRARRVAADLCRSRTRPTP